MTPQQFANAIDALKKAKIDSVAHILNYCHQGGAYRGRIKCVVGDADQAVLLIECIDVHDTSGAGNDFAALPLSQLKAISHDAMKWRYEKSQGV